MRVGELLDQIRGQYTTRLMEAADQLRQIAGVRVVSEAALRDRDGKLVVEGILALPVRLDLVSLADDEEPKSFSVDSSRILKFEQISFAWSDHLCVKLSPFQWDNLSVLIHTPPGAVTWHPLMAWFLDWFRADEDGEGELLGVVHFLSDPQFGDGSVLFAADLGSAPVEAFENLLDAVAAIGVSEVTIGGIP